MLNLLLGKRNEIVNRICEGVIVNLEEILHHLLVLLQFRKTTVMKIIPLLQHSRNPLHLLRHTVISHHLVLQPVAFLLISECSHEIIVIREIVETVERRNILKTLNKHTLFSQCIVIQRSVNLVHTVLPRPVLGSLQKKSGNFDVLYGIEPAEPDSLLGIALVVARIDHSANTSDHLGPAVEHHPHPALAVAQGGDLGQGVHLVRMEGRDILLIVLVQDIRELDETHQVFLVLREDLHYCIS